MTVTELREKKAKAVADARAIMAQADTESRSMTSEEETRFDTFMTEAESLTQKIERVEKLDGMESEQRSSRGRQVREEVRTTANGNDLLRSWLLMGVPGYRATDAERAAVAMAGYDPRELGFTLRSDALRSLNDFDSWQSRALATSPGSAGGFTVAQDFAGEVERAALAYGGMRAASRVLRTAGGHPLPWPLSDDTANGATIVAENTTIGDVDTSFASKTLNSYKFTGGILKVSMELLSDTSIDLPSIIAQMLGERLARGTNPYFTTGTGSGQPQGAVTGAVLGVTAASATTITYDELIDLEHSLDPAYRANAVFMFHDTVLRELKKLRDGNQRPIWQAGIAVGQPDTLLGYRYIVNQDMAPIGASAKSILFGDFSKHLIRDAGPILIKRLDERWAELGQSGFTILSRHDSAVLDAGTHPIKYLAQAAS